MSAGTAKNLKCSGCVGSSDIAKYAVTSSRIKNNSVSRSKIKDGAVTRDKPGSDVDTILDDVSDNFSLINDLEQRITNLEMGGSSNANVTSTAPTSDDVVNAGYQEGATWVNIITQQAYILVDSTAGSAIWKRITPVYEVGQREPAGGIVFISFSSGTEGYEVAPVDQGSAVWGCAGTPISGADGTDSYSGSTNTADILADCATADIAARLADNYSLNGFDDWFLPSKDLLNELYLLRDKAGAGPFIYWSSSEVDDNTAWAQSFIKGSQLDTPSNKFGALRVLAVRYF